MQSIYRQKQKVRDLSHLKSDENKRSPDSYLLIGKALGIKGTDIGI